MSVVGGACATNCTGKIDNISLVFGGYSVDQTEAYQSQVALLEKQGVLALVKTTRNGFRRNYKLKNDYIGSRVLLSTMSVSKNGPALRIEFNPAKIGPVKTKQVLLFVVENVLAGGAKELIEHAKVTRFDVAYDLHGLSLSDAFFWSEKAITSQTFNSLGMRTETLVFNQTKRRQVVVYDKAAEQLNKCGKHSSTPWTRIEVRKRNAGQLSQLKKTKCPMLDFRVSVRKKPSALSETAWVLLKNCIGPTTMQSVLAQLPVTKRAAIVNSFKGHPVSAWNPEKLWKEWPEIVENSGLLSVAVGS